MSAWANDMEKIVRSLAALDGGRSGFVSEALELVNEARKELARDRVGEKMLAAREAAITKRRANNAADLAFYYAEIEKARAAGCITSRQIANWLNEAKIAPTTGEKWTDQAVLRMERRYRNAKNPSSAS